MAFVTYTPTTNVWWDIVNTPLYLPSPGDVLTYDNLTLSTVATNPSGYTQQGFEAKVLDNLAWLKVHVTPTSTNTRVATSTPSWSGATGWQGSAIAVWSNGNNASSGQLWFELDSACLPNGVLLAVASMNITGSATDSSLPASMPQMKLWKVDNTGTATQLGSTTTDTTALISPYKVQHGLSVVLSPQVTIDRSTYTYWVELIPEHGANSNPGMLACTPFVTWIGNGTTLY